jgi:hypothetical protein
MAKIKLIKKPKKEEIEKDGRGNTIPPAGIGKYETSRRKK